MLFRILRNPTNSVCLFTVGVLSLFTAFCMRHIIFPLGFRGRAHFGTSSLTKSKPAFWSGTMAASTQSSQESLNSFLSRTSGRFGSVQKGGAGSHTHTSSNNDVDNSSRRVWHLVVGNQACDADSIVSAISYAYTKHMIQLRKSTTSNGTGNDDGQGHVYAPIVSCPREDFALRREAVYLLQTAGVDTSLLTFLDDVDFAQWEEQRKAKGEKSHLPVPGLILVDHNAPEGPFGSEFWCQATEEILDHHRDDGQVLHVQGSERKIDFDESQGKGIGSTCTLVAKEIVDQFPSLFTEEEALAKILLGTILLDTVNCSEAAGKATARDVGMIEHLKGTLPDSFDASALYDELLRQKSDPAFWRSLTPKQSLKYDFKQFTVGNHQSIVFGMSSILKPIEDFLGVTKSGGSIEDSVYSMKDFVEENNLSLLVVMSAVFEPTIKRQILLFAPAGSATSLYDKVKRALESSGKLQLKNQEDMPEAASDCLISVWDQHNTKASRKAVAPIVVDSLTE